MLRLVITIIASLVLAFVFKSGDAPLIAESKSLSVSNALRGNPSQESLEAYQRAISPRQFMFPQDHGPHPEFRSEWWYFTGNLADGQGHAFGYQLTFFRIALSPTQVVKSSAWSSNQLYMAHFAVSDISHNQFYHFERFNRAALGLAGAQTNTLNVWLDQWSAQTSNQPDKPIHLHAQQANIAIDLQLDWGKNVVLQGDKGLSQKSAETGNASYYYSHTRMPTVGTVTVDTKGYQVTGLSWLDREWSTSALGPQQVGWDWFSLQLSDNRELMYYRLRNQDGSSDPHSAGSLISTDGEITRLGADEVTLTPLSTWTSPKSRVRYPAQFQLEIPQQELNLIVTPRIADQELNTTVRYWEGAVSIRSANPVQPLTGYGYMELTGYGETLKKN